MKYSVDEREVWRYLGYRGNAVPDPTVQLRIRDVIASVEAAAVPRHISQLLALRCPGEALVELGTMRIRSADLAEHLTGCEQGILFAATLGTQVDRLIARAAVSHIADAAIAQAAAAALIEAYSDAVCRKFSEAAEKKGWYLRSRFSPGYGDFPMEYQRDIVEYLQAPQKLGLTVTDSLLLAPLKSITAVIGVSHFAQPCVNRGCAACTKPDCLMRKS